MANQPGRTAQHDASRLILRGRNRHVGRSRGISFSGDFDSLSSPPHADQTKLTLGGCQCRQLQPHHADRRRRDGGSGRVDDHAIQRCQFRSQQKSKSRFAARFQRPFEFPREVARRGDFKAARGPRQFFAPKFPLAVRCRLPGESRDLDDGTRHGLSVVGIQHRPAGRGCPNKRQQQFR